MQKYLVIVEKGKKNCSAYAPDVPGCIATGETVEETLRNMQEALVFHLEGLAEDGEAPPAARTIREHLDELRETPEAQTLWTCLALPAPETSVV